MASALTATTSQPVKRTTKPSALRRALGLAALTALLAAGCGEQEDVSPSFEDRIPPGLELEARDRVLELGQRTVLRGSLKQGKDRLAGEPVQLGQDRYPFDETYARIGETTTGKAGRFSFRVEPDSNTAYRVTFGELSEAESKPVRVIVDPVTKLEVDAVGGDTRFKTTFRHPKDRSIQGSLVFHYATTVAEAEATGELPFARVTKVDQVRSGVSVASVVVGDSASEQLAYKRCIGYTPDSGLGKPRTGCSQTSIPYRGGR